MATVSSSITGVIIASLTKTGQHQQMAVNRLAAIQALIDSLKDRYPEKGFLVNPNIRFCAAVDDDNDGGIGMRAEQKIGKDDILLVIPQAVRFSTENIMNTKELKKIAKTIETKCAYLGVDQMVGPEEFSLTMTTMYILSKKQNNNNNSTTDPFVLQAATWPSQDDMKVSSMFYWDDSKIKQIWNQSFLTTNFVRRRDNLRDVFERVIFPTLKNVANRFTDNSLSNDSSSKEEEPCGQSERDSLWDTFLYAFSIVWSRAHGSDTTPELLPLVELLNGGSERICRSEKPGKLVDKPPINVDMAGGMWPFLRGRMYADECNLPCAAVYASREIEKGEALIISYGDISPLDFVIKYGALPMECLRHHDIQTEVTLWFDPSLISTNDPMRLKCLERSEYPAAKFKSNEYSICELLRAEELDNYMNGHEPERIMCLRQVLILSMLAGEEELQRNYTTGRLRGGLYTSQVLPLMCQVVDYNIEKLAPGTNATSAEDVEYANKPGTATWEKVAFLLRAAYRESLLRWRHAIARQGIASHVDVKLGSSAPNPCLADGGCAVCGRSYPCLRCVRCKQIKYCSRSHQRQDWKQHKHQCTTT